MCGVTVQVRAVTFSCRTTCQGIWVPGSPWQSGHVGRRWYELCRLSSAGLCHAATTTYVQEADLSTDFAALLFLWNKVCVTWTSRFHQDYASAGLSQCLGLHLTCSFLTLEKIFNHTRHKLARRLLRGTAPSIHFAPNGRRPSPAAYPKQTWQQGITKQAGRADLDHVLGEDCPSTHKMSSGSWPCTTLLTQCIDQRKAMVTIGK